MPRFYGIAPGEEKTAAGLRVRVTADGESVYMSGKWLGLAEHHAVLFARRRAFFKRGDGRRLLIGQFPAWICQAKPAGRSRTPRPFAMMFDWTQFDGGTIEVD